MQLQAQPAPTSRYLNSVSRSMAGSNPVTGASPPSAKLGSDASALPGCTHSLTTAGGSGAGGAVGRGRHALQTGAGSASLEGAPAANAGVAALPGAARRRTWGHGPPADRDGRTAWKVWNLSRQRIHSSCSWLLSCHGAGRASDGADSINAVQQWAGRALQQRLRSRC